MQYIYSRETIEGEFIPLEQVDLHLDLKNDSDRLFLVTPQTICHPIDSDSPLYHLNKESLKEANFEVSLVHIVYTVFVHSQDQWNFNPPARER